MSQPFDTFNSGSALANATTDNTTSEELTVDYWMDFFYGPDDDIANNNVAVNDNSAVDVGAAYDSTPTWNNTTMVDLDMPSITPMAGLGTLQSMPTIGEWGLGNTAFTTVPAWPIVSMNDPFLGDSMPTEDVGMPQSILTTGDGGLGNTAFTTAPAWPNVAMDNTRETINPGLLMDSSQTVPIDMSLPPTAAPSTAAPFTSAPFTSAPFTTAPFTTTPFTGAPFTSAPFTTPPFTSAPFTSTPARSAMATGNTPQNGFMATGDMSGNGFMATGDVSGSGFTATNNTFGNGFMATDNMATNVPMATQNATSVMQPPPVPGPRVRTASDALRAQADQRAAQRAMRPARRPPASRVECTLCDERPDGFRSHHELDRHTKARHRDTVDQFEIVDAGRLVTASNQVLTKPLADCNNCSRRKQYNSEQNAIAHLRSMHFAAGQSNGNRGRVSRELPLEDMRAWVKKTVVSAASVAEAKDRL
ncbi:hypothetical protein J3F83DRAFT_718587 [Trichoderma novae-zelandiae]